MTLALVTVRTAVCVCVVGEGGLPRRAIYSPDCLWLKVLSQIGAEFTWLSLYANESFWNCEWNKEAVFALRDILRYRITLAEDYYWFAHGAVSLHSATERRVTDSQATGLGGPQPTRRSQYSARDGKVQQDWG